MYALPAGPAGASGKQVAPCAGLPPPLWLQRYSGLPAARERTGMHRESTFLLSILHYAAPGVGAHSHSKLLRARFTVSASRCPSKRNRPHGGASPRPWPPEPAILSSEPADSLAEQTLGIECVPNVQAQSNQCASSSITIDCDVRHIGNDARGINVPTDVLWGEVGADCAELESAAFSFVGPSNRPRRMLFSYLFPLPGYGPEVRRVRLKSPSQFRVCAGLRSTWGAGAVGSASPFMERWRAVSGKSEERTSGAEAPVNFIFIAVMYGLEPLPSTETGCALMSRGRTLLSRARGPRGREGCAAGPAAGYAGHGREK